MHKKVSLLALLFSVLLFSTFLNVNAMHTHVFQETRPQDHPTWQPEFQADCKPVSIAGADHGNGYRRWVIVCSNGSSGGTEPPTLQTMTQADFEDLIRRTFAQDGVKIQDLEDDVSKAVLDALNQGQLKIDFEEV